MSYETAKRIIDIFGAVFLLGLFSPVMLATAIIIKLTSPGPVFADIPKRVGKDGKLFYPYKFRSMIINAYHLLNVLKGEMSIIGPRPYYKEELDKQVKIYPGTAKHIKEALKVRPGITGYWQVTGRSDVNFDKRIEMDAYYARKRSLFFDLLIILKTPWAMISGKGAV